MQEAWEPFHAYHVEHIIAKQHRGLDSEHNLAFSCHRCNLLKGPNLSSRDPDADRLVPLFHPRQDSWERHFQRESARIFGITDIGRTTVFLLEMNADDRVNLREMNLHDW